MWNFTGKQRPGFAVEPSGNQESVWDYPRPPGVFSDTRHIVVRHGDFEIANSTRAHRILETASPPTIYLARDDIRMEVLIENVGSTFCEWKGQATYWSLQLDGQLVKNVGWSYEQPSVRFEAIRGHLSFYPALLDCLVDGQKVRAQSGGFYGGWVTDEIVGPYKGEPGTGGW